MQKLRSLMVMLLVVLVLANTALAEQGGAPSTPPDYPGVAEVVPAAAKLTAEVAAAEAQIAVLKDSAAVEGQLKASRGRLEALEERIRDLGDPATWSFERLQETRSSLNEIGTSLKKTLDSLSAQLTGLDALRQALTEKGTYWTGWKESLGASLEDIPADLFPGAERQIDLLVGSIGEASVPLVALQKEVTTLQERKQETLGRIEATLDALRRQTFKKTAHSFLSPRFYRQFGPDLARAVKAGIASVQPVRLTFFADQGWVLALQALLALALAGFIVSQRKSAEVGREWVFIVHHPLATGIFVALAALSVLYSNPPSLWRLILWVGAAFSAATLVGGLLTNPRKIFMVWLVALLFVLSLGLQIIALPHPLYRLYLALVSLVGVPLLLILAQINRLAHEGRSDGFTLSLRLGALILLVSFGAQLTGFSNLSFRLIESSLKTVFLGLFAAMAVRLGRGAIDYVLGRGVLLKRRFFRLYGDELAPRLKGLLQAVIVGYAGLFFFEVWGIYASPGDAWTALLEMSFTLGEVEFSAGMVLLVVATLCLAMALSWLVRALLDAHFFPSRTFDRGVRDSIKRLLHYALIFVGFLLAMSLAGVELKNFAVVAGAFGIGIGFGLQNIVNNFVSGLILLFERPVKVGDVIVVDQEWSMVRKIGLRSTVVETLNKSEIIVPNSDLISQKVTNWTLTTSMARVVVPVGVAYGSDVEKVMGLLREAVDNHPDVLKDPAPNPIFCAFGESSLDFELRFWIADVSRILGIKSEILQKVDALFRVGGVEIPFPQRDLHLRSMVGKGAAGFGEGEGEPPGEGAGGG